MSQTANQQKEKKLDFGDDKDHMCIPARLVNSLKGKKKKEKRREEGRGKKKRHNVTNKNEDHPKAEPNENQMLCASLANLSPDRRTTCNIPSLPACEGLRE